MSTNLECACGHTYKQHQGYVRGPNIQEWCEGAGFTIYNYTQGPDDEGEDSYPTCPCREYDGPLPEDDV